MNRMASERIRNVAPKYRVFETLETESRVVRFLGNYCWGLFHDFFLTKLCSWWCGPLVEGHTFHCPHSVECFDDMTIDVKSAHSCSKAMCRRCLYRIRKGISVLERIRTAVISVQDKQNPV
jgi:hypothetical protein